MNSESVNSSPCSLPDTDPAYNGFLTHDELRELLLSLSRVEATCTRVCDVSQDLAETDTQRAILKAIRENRATSCEHLAHALRSIGLRPEPRASEHNAVANFDAGVDFLNQSQRWAIKRITGALPGISSAAVLQQMVTVLRSHEDDTTRLESLLKTDHQ